MPDNEQEKENSIKKLVKTRGTQKACITKIETFVNDFPQEDGNFALLKIKLENLMNYACKYDEVQTDLEIFSDEYDNDRFDIQDMVDELRSKIENILTKKENGSKTGSSSSNTAPIESVRLPEIKLPSFEGSYENWLSFSQYFMALVHNNGNLSDVQKFHYLISALSGQAKQLVKNLPLTPENYIVAWNLLKTRYENKLLIASKHMKEILDVEPIHKESFLSLGKFIDIISCNINALKALNLDVNFTEAILVHFLTRKLDQNTIKTWEKTLNSNSSLSLETFVQFLEKHRQILENTTLTDRKQASSSNIVTKPKDFQSHSSFEYNRGNRPNKLFANTNTTTGNTVKVKCSFCNNEHHLYQCDKFQNIPVTDRFSFAKNHNLCLNCLKFGHMLKNCTSSYSCKGCNRKHHTLLHFDRTSNQSQPVIQTAVQAISGSFCSLKAHNSINVLLATAIVKVVDSTGRTHHARALLDSGSQVDFISERLAHCLGLKRHSTQLDIAGINNILSQSRYTVNIKLLSKYSDFSANLKCFVLPKITSEIPSAKIPIDSWKIPKNVNLADENFNLPGKVDLLLGVETFFAVLSKGQICLADNLPTLQETAFGWIVAGKLPTSNCFVGTTKLHSFFVNQVDVQSQLEKFWEIEEIHSTPRSKEDEACEVHFKQKVKHSSDGRFIVSLPRRENADELGDSLKNANNRFLSLERKFKKNPNLQQDYANFMQEYLDLGHMKVIKPDDMHPCNGTYYLPHHAVFKDSTTTRTRVVFDASCKTNYGPSLNDILMVGPKTQEDIVLIISRFRTHIYAMIADIEKMYRQILVSPSDCDLQRILWRENNQSELKHYKLLTVTYGTGPAAFLATRCLTELANENSHEFPEAASIIKRDFYMDDLQTGSDSISDAIKLQQQISKILDSVGCKLRKWCSNDPRILEGVPMENQETKPIIEFDNSRTVNTLGLSWNFSKDVFTFNIKIAPLGNKISKRTVLSVIASIYDPLGLIGPIIALCKIFMQNLWHEKLNWDEELPPKLKQAWINIYRKLPTIQEISVPRLLKGTSKTTKMEIHGFSDASQEAYGACLYLRCIYNNGTCTTRLICSKSRVAPVQQITLPRLELCGAVLLARLYNYISPALNLKIDNCYLWSDSTVVLSWLSALPVKWKTFVANRVSEIQTLTEHCQWQYINSADNPADVLSRGAAPLELKSHPLWWNGPGWLSRAEDWPQSKLHIEFNTDHEVRKIKSFVISQNCYELSVQFSSLNRMLRILSYCRRFIHNLKSKNKITSELTVKDLDATLSNCIRSTQETYFQEEMITLREGRDLLKKSKLLNLCPFLDEFGCLRVGGRLQQSSLSFDSKHQIILPSKCHLTKLIVEHEHCRLLHAGPQLLLSSLRGRYWILNGRNTIRSIIHRCIRCFRFRAVEAKQLMGELPKHRVQISKPFYNCGVDYAGPFPVRQGGRRSKLKVQCFIALFVCLSTRAIHLELVSDLTSEAFIAALRRFTARRGLSANIYSDNGTNFVGANKELKVLYNQIKNEEFKSSIAKHTTREGIQWHFIPPRSPHFGGLWEAGVKSMKYHLRRIVGNLLLTFEELNTILLQVEACLNSRPICSLSNDPNDPQSLTPGHFLVGGPLVSLPDFDCSQIPSNRLNRWQLAQQCVQHVWKRWSQDYLTQLQQRTKWTTSSPNLQPGTLVLLKEDNSPPLSWKLAVIEQVHPGPDGLVRVVTVRTATSTIKRPICKLCPLPTSDEL